MLMIASWYLSTHLTSIGNVRLWLLFKLFFITNYCLYHWWQDTSSNDLNEYEIRNEITKLGYANIPLTDSTRPILSNIIRRKRERNNKLK